MAETSAASERSRCVHQVHAEGIAPTALSESALSELLDAPRSSAPRPAADRGGMVDSVGVTIYRYVYD